MKKLDYLQWLGLRLGLEPSTPTLFALGVFSCFYERFVLNLCQAR